MADVSSRIYQWSTNEASNSPSGATTIGSGLDDNLRQIQATVRADLSAKGANIASAATTDLGAIAGSVHDITGTTTITSFGTVDAGIAKTLQFNSTLVLKYNASSLILPSALDVTAQPTDCLYAISLGSGNWRVPFYSRASGVALVDNSVAPPFTDATAIVKGSSDTTKLLRIEADGLTTATTRVWTVQDRSITVADVLDNSGCGQLSKSGSNLVLLPYNGTALIINSTVATIPDQGATLIPTGTTSTLHYVYAYLGAASTMQLEGSVTVPTTQGTTGVRCKFADATRSLVGMYYNATTTAFVDGTAQRFVRSWFNDLGVGTKGSFSAARGTTSASYAEMASGTEIRNEFLVWSGEIVHAVASGGISSDTGGSANLQAGIAFDGATPELGRQQVTARTASDSYPFAVGCVKTGLSEGYHYATLVGKTNTGTLTLNGGSIPDCTALQCMIP